MKSKSTYILWFVFYPHQNWYLQTVRLKLETDETFLVYHYNITTNDVYVFGFPIPYYNDDKWDQALQLLMPQCNQVKYPDAVTYLYDLPN